MKQLGYKKDYMYYITESIALKRKIDESTIDFSKRCNKMCIMCLNTLRVMALQNLPLRIFSIASRSRCLNRKGHGILDLNMHFVTIG